MEFIFINRSTFGFERGKKIMEFILVWQSRQITYYVCFESGVLRGMCQGHTVNFQTD